MSPPNTQLDELRRQIDGLDDRIHDLLIERSAMIERIVAAKGDGQPKLRPGREAEIARRIVGRHRGHFPAPSLVRIWREIINAFTCMQGPFSIALSGAAEDRRIRELARDHFGGTPERIVVEDTEAALRGVIAGDATLAVLPWGDRAGPWLRQMLDAGEVGLSICFGLPFVRTELGESTKAVAVGQVQSEATVRDRSILAIELPQSADRDTIEAAAVAAKYEPYSCWDAAGDGTSLWIVEVSGRVDRDPEPVLRLVKSLAGGRCRVTPLGGYAEPIVLSQQERTDT